MNRHACRRLGPGDCRGTSTTFPAVGGMTACPADAPRMLRIKQTRESASSWIARMAAEISSLRLVSSPASAAVLTNASTLWLNGADNASPTRTCGQAESRVDAGTLVVSTSFSMLLMYIRYVLGRPAPDLSPSRRREPHEQSKTGRPERPRNF